MKTIWKSIAALLLSAVVITGGQPGVWALEPGVFETALTDTADYIYRTVSDPQVDSIGGEWAVIGLARSGYAVPESYDQKYYQTVEETLKACGGNLHDKKYTEYSRVILALTAIGKDPSNVAGYNLLTPLGDYDATIWQGLNGPIWALIALDSGTYDIPENPTARTQATRERYIGRILECQLPDGGWSLLGGTEAASSEDSTADPDITGMALQALAKYQDRADVKQATDDALACMSGLQNETGGYSSWGRENLESSVQMIVALCELGLPLTDDRFVKNENTLLDSLMRHYVEGGGFATTAGGEINQMSSEQGLYALAAVERVRTGQSSLYRMTDRAPSPSGGDQTAVSGLPGKHADIAVKEVQFPGKTFPDINGHKSQAAIEALAERSIINGMSDDAFAPDATMTRAEFAAIIVRGLGLPEQEEGPFTDVPDGAWFAPSVNTAFAHGIVNGISEDVFNPSGTITREEAAVMVSRSAALCGMDTSVTLSAARDALAGFLDYVRASDWAVSSLAFCLEADILPDDAMELNPQQSITRAEIAQMLYQLLTKANLL